MHRFRSHLVDRRRVSALRRTPSPGSGRTRSTSSPSRWRTRPAWGPAPPSWSPRMREVRDPIRLSRGQPADSTAKALFSHRVIAAPPGIVKRGSQHRNGMIKWRAYFLLSQTLVGDGRRGCEMYFFFSCSGTGRGLWCGITTFGVTK